MKTVMLRFSHHITSLPRLCILSIRNRLIVIYRSHLKLLLDKQVAETGRTQLLVALILHPFPLLTVDSSLVHGFICQQFQWLFKQVIKRRLAYLLKFLSTKLESSPLRPLMLIISSLTVYKTYAPSRKKNKFQHNSMHSNLKGIPTPFN